jgi:AAA+ ATPase superfamily predicted ATPase
MKFYDRNEELEKLEKFLELSRQNLFFIRISGRRRIGKTLLVRQFLSKAKIPSLYFFVTKKKEKPLLDEYASIIREQFPDFTGISFNHFDDFLAFIFNLMKRREVIVVFDEFQNFKYVNPAIFSILQKHIDLNKQTSKGLLLIIGSINSMMRRIFENRNQPLYGRLNGSFLLKHFSTATVKEILADRGLHSNEDLVFFYSLFQGIPFYYNYIDERRGYKKSRGDFFKQDILDENSILLNEGKEILVEEFGKDYSTYFSILEALAGGATTMSRIADVSSIAVHSLSRYISELVEDHEIIERKTPFDSKKSSKMGRYYINDHFLDFWFRYIFKNKSRIEMVSIQRVADEIINDLPTFIGRKFEAFMISHLVEMNRQGRMRFDRIGQYWDRGETEIDIIFTDDEKRVIWFGECKLSPKRFKVDALEEKIKKFLDSHRRYTGWKKVLNLYTPAEEGFLYRSLDLDG